MPRPVEPSYIWGGALDELKHVAPAARIVNLETTVTRSDDALPKGINYRMHPANVACLSVAQAQALDRFLQALGQRLEHVVNVEVSEPELRRVCGACGTTFDAASPPQRAGVCDSCGGELYQREDDRERTVRERLDVYARQTRLLLDYYRGRGLLDTVSGPPRPSDTPSGRQ